MRADSGDAMITPQPTARQALARHWPEYLMEAWGLGAFLVSAGIFATLLEYPGSPVRQAIDDSDFRRALMGLAMGLTAMAIIYSPWGKQSGAHINPAVTLTFLRLGKVAPWDAMFYIAAQFAGGAFGILVVWAVLGTAFSAPPVQFVATLPGPAGSWPAFLAEVAMAGGLMLTILTLLGSPRMMAFVGVFAGAIVACYITVLAPVSGMSINPARSFASAVPAGLLDFLWIYLTAPVIGMLGAVEIHRRLGSWLTGRRHWFCAKLNHDDHYRCIHCGHDPAARRTAEPAGSAP